MISAIRNRLIYADPSDGGTKFEAERRRIQQKNFEERVKKQGLIPSGSGPPANIFGQHLPTIPDEFDEEPKKKKEKGVWYVPWYEDEDRITKESMDTIVLSSMDTALQSLIKSGIVWDIDKPKGKKSRENFTRYMQLVGAAMWQEKKSSEDDCIFGSVISSNRLTSRSTRHNISREDIQSMERGGGGGSSIGGPGNSANVFGRGRRGRRGRGGGGRGNRGTNPSSRGGREYL